MALNEQIRKSQLSKGIYYYFLPTYKQAKQVIWDSLVKDHVPLELVNKFNESELAIYWKNGSIQRFAGCEDIDKHRGINPIDVVFDEYSEIDERMWTIIIQPVLRENHGTATFIFTPKGMNHSWKLLKMAQDSDQWFSSVKSVDDTGAINKGELEQARKETPEAFFKQEYYCEFLENAGAFFRRVKENLWDGELYPESSHSYQVGADYAKYQDWTVLTPFDLSTFLVGKQDRFNQVDWNLQKARTEAFVRKYNDAVLVPDSTGVGDPVVEDLQRNGITTKGFKDDDIGFKFTETSRQQLLDNLAVLLEQDKIKIPNDDGLITELQSFQYSLNKNNKPVVKVPDGMTDDRVMSLALAVWGAKHPIGKNTNQEFNLYQQDYS